MTAKSLPYLYGLLILGVMLLWIPGQSRGDQKEDIPPATRMALYKAGKLMEKDRFSEASEILEEFRKRGKISDERDSKGYNHYLIHFTLGNCYLMTRKYPEAEACYRAAITLNPAFHTGWMNLAKCRHEMNAHAEAGHAFLKGYETAPKKDPGILYYGAVSFMTAGETREALKVFRTLLHEHPPQEIKLEWKEGLVHAYFDSHQEHKALPFIEELSEKTKGKKRRQWQEVRLHTYLSLDMKTKALRYVRRLIREYPTEPRWWKGLAHLHLKENRYGPALVALTIKGFLDPLTTKEQKIVGDLNMAMGIPVQAVRTYERLAGRNVDPDLAHRIAQGYIRLHEPSKALEWIEKALLTEKRPGLALLKGDLLYELKRYPEAVTAFERAARGKKSVGRAWLMAGYSAWNAGDPARARGLFQKAAGHSRQKKAAVKALQQLDSKIAPDVN